MLDWTTPVGEGREWAPQLIEHFVVLVDLIDPLRADPLTEQGWEAAKRVLDAARPETAAKANEDWRRFVVAVWKVVDGHAQRQRLAAAARRARRQA